MSDVVPQVEQPVPSGLPEGATVTGAAVPEPQPVPAAPSTTPTSVVVRYEGVPSGEGYWEPTGQEIGVNWYPGRELEVPADRAATLLDRPGFAIGKPIVTPRQP